METHGGLPPGGGSISAHHAPLRVLVVGAGDGIGRACAAAFAERGAELTIADVDQPKLQAAAAELGAQARFCDMASEASVAVFAADLIASGTVPEILINAAGDGYVRTLGMVWLSRELLPAMRASGGARLIVNVAPSREHPLTSGHYPFAASPLAFRSLSEALAMRTKGSSTTVMTVVQPHGSSDVRPIRGLENDAILLETADAGTIAECAARLIRDDAWRASLKRGATR